jgi:signal transduction histidine kinase
MKIERIETFLEGLAAGVLVLDSAGNIAAHNQRALSLLDVDVEDLLLHPIEDLVPDESFPALIRRLENGDIAAQSAVLRIGERRIDCRGRLLVEEGTHVVVLTLEDAGGRRRLEALKQEFVGTILHKIRSPLATVKTALSILDDNRPSALSADMGEVLDMCRHETDRLNAVLNGLRDLYSIETGVVAREIELEHFPVRQAFERAAARAGGDASGRIQAAGALDTAVTADFQKLARSIELVLDNALRFSTGRVDVVAALDDDVVTLSVRDRGVGVKPESRPLLGTKFFREDNEATRSFDGNGLGLFIVKSWLDLMHGSLSYEEAPDGGSIFMMTIPLEARE